MNHILEILTILVNMSLATLRKSTTSNKYDTQLRLESLIAWQVFPKEANTSPTYKSFEERI